MTSAGHAPEDADIGVLGPHGREVGEAKPVVAADEVEIGIGRAQRIARRPGRPSDVGRVATDRPAGIIEGRDAIGERGFDALRRGARDDAEGVPLVGVASRDPQASSGDAPR